MSQRQKYWESRDPMRNPVVSIRGSQSGPSIQGGLPWSATIPESGPARRDDFPPCQTRCHGRKCGKRVAHQHEGVWRCISCGEIREEPTNGR